MKSDDDHKEGHSGSLSLLKLCVRLVLGRPLANREGHARQIGVAEAVPAMGLDGLSSSAYGPEASLSVLAAAGAAAFGLIGPIMLVILVLLGLLFVSYWQTIEAYPKSGGAYIVTKENLGVNASLLAATALMIDYVLNVAVGHFRRRSGAGFGAAGAACLHAAPLSRRARAADVGQSARHYGCRAHV